MTTFTNTGKGFDRHLFALKCLAEGDSVPFFKDPSYNKLNNIILSTSTLATPSIAFGGFGPVNDDSYGIGYRVTDQFLGKAAKEQGEMYVYVCDMFVVHMYNQVYCL